MSSTAAAAPQGSLTDRITGTPVLKYVPGVLLLIVLGLIGKWAQAELKVVAKSTGTHLPDIEYVLWAIGTRQILKYRRKARGNLARYNPEAYQALLANQIVPLKG